MPTFRDSIRPRCAAAAIALFAAGSRAEALEAREGSAAFEARGPAGFRIVGTTSDVRVSEQGQDVRVVVTLRNLDTGIGLRNEHLRKDLDVATFPTASLAVPRRSLDVPEQDDEHTASAIGALSLHGHTRPLPFTYAARRNGKELDVTGSATLDVTDYGVPVPSYFGIRVAPDVALRVHFVAIGL